MMHSKKTCQDQGVGRKYCTGDEHKRAGGKKSIFNHT
jgi:hypothetical protein